MKKELNGEGSFQEICDGYADCIMGNEGYEVSWGLQLLADNDTSDDKRAFVKHAERAWGGGERGLAPDRQRRRDVRSENERCDV